MTEEEEIEGAVKPEEPVEVVGKPPVKPATEAAPAPEPKPVEKPAEKPDAAAGATDKPTEKPPEAKPAAAEKPPEKKKPEKPKREIKKVSIRQGSQVFILVLSFILIYFIYSSPMAICWLDPFWHLQAFIAAFPNLDLNIHLLQGENAIDAAQRIIVPSILYLGVFMFIGLLFGRIFCGWICPFGTLLEYLEGVSPMRGRYIMPVELKDPGIKYIILAAFLFLAFISSQEVFCEFCPAGAVFKGATGYMIALSVPVFIAVFFTVFSYGRKTWCSYLCPLGAFFGLFSKIHLFGIRAEKDKCVKCFMCNQTCPMDVLIVEDYINKGKKINDGDCIKCMNCVDACPRKILKFP